MKKSKVLSPNNNSMGIISYPPFLQSLFHRWYMPREIRKWTRKAERTGTCLHQRASLRNWHGYFGIDHAGRHVYKLVLKQHQCHGNQSDEGYQCASNDGFFRVAFLANLARCASTRVGWRRCKASSIRPRRWLFVQCLRRYSLTGSKHLPRQRARTARKVAARIILFVNTHTMADPIITTAKMQTWWYLP